MIFGFYFLVLVIISLLLYKIKYFTHPIVNKLVFHPTNQGYDPVITVTFATDNTQNISVPYIQFVHENSKKYIIFAHGNACSMYTLSYYFRNICEISKVNVISFEYPGYSVCPGTPSEYTCGQNLNILIDHLINEKNIKQKNIYLVGQSIGTGIVANYVATHDWSNSIMLISPYKTIASIVLKDNFINNILKSFFDMFETINKVDKINCPVKIVHGEKDELISIDHGKEIYEKLKYKLAPTWLQDANHNNILNLIDYDVWEEFLNSKLLPTE